MGGRSSTHARDLRVSFLVITEAEARTRILEAISPLGDEEVALQHALDRFAAGNLQAGMALPAFDNSAMDGYAVRASDCRAGERLRVVGEQPAGRDRRLRIVGGEAVRIFTGAPLPAGADAVIMQEETAREGDEVILRGLPEPGEFIRKRGADLTIGQKIVAAGERLTPQKLGLIASQGLAQIAVGRRAMVAIVSSGDELRPPGSALREGEIFDSNSVMLAALAAKTGAQITSSACVGDHLDATVEALETALRCDAVLITGGVSVGALDLIKPALLQLGAETDFWSVAVKPGKPFLFGRRGKSRIFGLPGNPVSAFVTFLVFVRPALLKWMGAGPEELELRQAAARTEVELTNPGDRPHYLRGELRDGAFSPIGVQESHALFGLSRANALVRLAPGATVAVGSAVQALTWD